jgi:hypothetical protein
MGHTKNACKMDFREQLSKGVCELQDLSKFWPPFHFRDFIEILLKTCGGGKWVDGADTSIRKDLNFLRLHDSLAAIFFEDIEDIMFMDETMPC